MAAYSQISGFPDEIVLNIITSLRDEDLLRFAESSPRFLRLVSDPNFLNRISVRDFMRSVDNLEDYRRFAAKFSVTRDSPFIIGLDKSFERASEKGDEILIDQFAQLYILEQRKPNVNRGLIGAAAGGHKHLVEYFIKYGADSYENAKEKTLIRLKGEYIPFDYGYDIEDPLKNKNEDELPCGPNEPGKFTIGGGYEDLEILKILSPEEISKEEEATWTLRIAARKGDLEVLEKGLPEIEPFFEDMPPDLIDDAMKGGHIKVIELLNRMFGKYIAGGGIAESAAERGQVELLKYILETFRESSVKEYIFHVVGPALVGAIHGSQKDVVDFLINFIDSDPNLQEAMDYRELEEAAEKGYIEIVRRSIENKMIDYNKALLHGARGGHMNIVQLSIENGADNYGEAMFNAAGRGHSDIVNLLMEKLFANGNEYETFDNIILAAECAAGGGYIQQVEILIEKGKFIPDEEETIDMDRIIAAAVKAGNIKVVKGILKLSKNDISFNTIKKAIHVGYLDILTMLLDHGITKGTYDKLTRYLLTHGIPEMKMLVNKIDRSKLKKI